MRNTALVLVVIFLEGVRRTLLRLHPSNTREFILKAS
jgi:hypothetical protein